MMRVKHQKQIDSYDLARKSLTPAQLREWAVHKALNGADIAKRVRGQSDAEVTIAARRGKRLTGDDRALVGYVASKLAEAGMSFDLEQDHTDGMAYASIKIRGLNSYSEPIRVKRKSLDAWAKTAVM